MPARLRSRLLARVGLVLLVLAAVLTIGQPAHADGIVYVVPGGTGDGSSWTNAKDLALALATAHSGQTLWVKAGTYKPDAGVNRSATFALKTGVAVYGGFAGTEETLADRNWQTNVTTLSGVLNVAQSMYSYHVVTGSGTTNTAILDGFTITGGRADSSNGGGMLIDGGNPTLTNLIFDGNSAHSGGGLSTRNSSPPLTNVTFTRNTADVYGGGLYVEGNDSITRLTLDGVTFIGNSATGDGGGLYGLNTRLSTGSGGVTFSGNSGRNGGGLFNDGTDVRLGNVIFRGNRASVDGGGMASVNASAVTLANALFSGNRATGNGGGASQSDGSFTVTDATWSGNAAGRGGALHNSSASVTVSNSILWGDSATLFPEISGPAGVTYSIVQQASGVYLGTGNLNADPLFVAPIAASAAPTADGNYHLQTTSPAIDAGDPNAKLPDPVPPDDLDGNPRPSTPRGRIDMGAYEAQDTTPPDTTITETPPNPSNSFSASFSFSGSDTGGSGLGGFECSLDNATFAPCTSNTGQSYSGLSDGSHTFQVRARDRSGNVDPTPASYTWVVDTTPPPPPVVTAPANASSTNNLKPTVSGTAEANSTVTVYIDGSSRGTASADSSGAWSFPLTSALSEGTHTVRARATDAAGNTSVDSNTNSFKVDTMAPTTLITGKPSTLTNSASATFTFSANDGSGSGVASVQCSLDNAAFTGCASSTSQGYSNLTDGSHTFTVKATDNAGNTDDPGASYTSTVDTVAPTISVTTPANGATYAVGQVVTVSYTCADTGGSGVKTCTSTPANGSRIDTSTVGAKSFTVNATDNAGNPNSVTVNYVVGYTVTYVSPTVGPPSVNAVYPTGMGPWTTTTKWKLTNGSQAITTGTVAAVRYASMTCGGTAPAYSDSLPMAGGFSSTNPRYDVFQAAWLMNWQLPGRNACYVLYVKMGTGQVIPFLYNIH